MVDLDAVQRHAQDRTLPTLIALLAHGDEESRWLARALRLDLGVLTAHPELVLPCVYQRGWFGVRDVAPYHGEAAGPPSAPPLRGLLSTWLLRGLQTEPWLRALRPPACVLDGPLVEEYRGELPARGRPRLSDDGGAVGVVGDAGVIGWDRRSGERLSTTDAEQRLTRPPPRYRGAGSDNEVTLSDDRGSYRIRTGELWCVDCVADATDDHAIVAGWFDAYVGAVVRIDPRRQREVWWTELNHAVRAIDVSRDGTLVLAGDGHRHHLLDAKTGALLISLDLGGVGVFSRDGREIAVVDGDTVRIWDVAGLRRGEHRPLPGRDGIVQAQFSPDGKRLITGDLLCDGVTGAPIARIEVDHGHYLEGGPPEHARLLARDRFIETRPLGGIHVWDSATGALLLRDPDRRHGMGDVFRVSPAGTCYAEKPEYPRDAALVLRALDGEELAHFGRHVFSVEFSPDGSHLAFGTSDGSVWLARGDGSDRHRIGVHEGGAGEIAFSCDGRLLATRHLHDVKLWSLRGELIAERTIAAWDHDDGGSPRERFESLHGWSGFRVRAHPWRARCAGGMHEIVVDDDRVIARLPGDGLLTPSPDGTRWANRQAHLALEGVSP